MANSGASAGEGGRGGAEDLRGVRAVLQRREPCRPPRQAAFRHHRRPEHYGVCLFMQDRTSLAPRQCLYSTSSASLVWSAFVTSKFCPTHCWPRLQGKSLKEVAGPSVSAQAEIRKKANRREIGEFGAGCPDYGGWWPRGDALGRKRKRGKGIDYRN